ncbi:MAG: SOS response-associated peptidase family protein [Chitinophagaceae bacterium]
MTDNPITDMCYRTKLTATISQIEEKFEGRLEPVPELFNPGLELNGFAMPHTPVLCADDISHLKIIQWGYEVHWQTAPLLNAQFETAQDKMSFKPYLQQRCLIAADGFYEWKWLDEKGKKKEKYLLQLPDESVFFLCGQYRDSTDTKTGEIHRSYIIYTLSAEGVMRDIHNSKMRMPYAIRDVEAGIKYLKGENPNPFIAWQPIKVS